MWQLKIRFFVKFIPETMIILFKKINDYTHDSEAVKIEVDAAITKMEMLYFIQNKYHVL